MVVSSAAQFVPTRTETLSNKIQFINQLKSKISLYFGPNEQKKVKFLVTHSDFFTQVNYLTQSEVQAQLKASNLELTGLPHDILLVEEKLNKLLRDIEILNFQFPLQVGTILGFNSPKQLVSELMSIANVLVHLKYDRLSDKALITATGFERDVKAFEKELHPMIDSVISNNFVVPEKFLTSKEFSSLCLQLNGLPNTFVSAQHGVVTAWSNSRSNLMRVQLKLDRLINRTQSTNYVTESLSLSKVKQRYIFVILKPELSHNVNMNWKSYDGKLTTLELRGELSEVKKTVAKVQKLSHRITTATVSLTAQSVKALGNLTSFFGNKGQYLVVKKPEEGNPSITITGLESQVNDALLKVYKTLETKCSKNQFSMINTSLLFSYLNYEEFKYDENNLRLFCATFPEAVIEWKSNPNGLIQVKITSSPNDLSSMKSILKRNVIVPLSSFKDTSSVSTIASVLQQNGKLEDELGARVAIEEKADHILISTNKDDNLVEAYDVLYDITQRYQQRQYTTDRMLLVPGNLLDDIKATAEAYEVMVAFSSDSSKEGKLIIDFVGRSGNCEIFKTYLDMKLSSLTRLDVTSTNTCSLTNRILHADEEKKSDAFVMYHPKSNDYWIGGEEVESIGNLIIDNCLEESVFYGDEKMSEYLRVQIDGLAAQYSTVSMGINSDELEIQINGPSKDAREVTQKISDIVSECGVYEHIIQFDKTLYEGAKFNLFRTLLANQSLTLEKKVSPKLSLDDDEDKVKLQMVGNKSSVKKMVEQLNELGNISETCTRDIKLPYSGQCYLNYLQTKLGVPNVSDESNSFFLQSFWGPLVQCDQNCDRKILRNTSDLSRNWKLTLSGDERNVKKTEKIIGTAMSEMNFNRIKILLDDMNYGMTALTGTEFVQSALADGIVKFYVEFYDENTKECYVNVFGEDRERVDNLVSKIKSFSLHGLKTIIFNVHDYVGQDFPVKNCFYNSRLVEEMNEARETIYWWYNKDAHRIILTGAPDSVGLFNEKIMSWFKSLETKTKIYSDQESYGKRILYEPYHEYCRKRWPYITFVYGRKEKAVHFSGIGEDVNTFEEYVSNEVRCTIPKYFTNGDARLQKTCKFHLAMLYPGVFVSDGENELVLHGEKSEVDDVITILKAAIEKNTVEDITFKLRIKDKMFDIPYTDVVRVFISVKYKQYWPNLRFHISGREIYFAGPEKDIDECSIILGNLVMWRIPNSVMESATLFRDHRTKEGNFRDSHFVPPQLLDKLFIDRAKGYDNTGQVTVWGLAEQIKPLSRHIDEVLPQMWLTRKTVLLTEKQSMFLSGPHGWRAMFPQFEDQVAYSFSNSYDSVEIVGDSESVSQIENTLEKFTTEIWTVFQFPPGKEKVYWNFRLSKKVKKEFPRTLFDDSSRSVCGFKSDVNSIEKLLTNQVTKGSKMFMTERDVWNITLETLKI